MARARGDPSSLPPPSSSRRTRRRARSRRRGERARDDPAAATGARPARATKTGTARPATRRARAEPHEANGKTRVRELCHGTVRRATPGPQGTQSGPARFAAWHDEFGGHAAEPPSALTGAAVVACASLQRPRPASSTPASASVHAGRQTPGIPSVLGGDRHRDRRARSTT